MARPDLNEAPPATDAPRPISWPMIGLAAVSALLLLIVLGLLNELGPFLLAGLNVLPFVGLAVLAALGETRRWARWLAYLYLIALGLGVLGISASLVFAAGLGGNLTAPNALEADNLLVASRPLLTYLGIGSLLLIVALLPLLPPVRRLVARWLPLNPASATHTVGLSATLMLALLPLAALVVLGGQPPLLTLIAGQPGGADLASLNRPIDLFYGLVWLLPASLVIVGYPIRRSVGAAILRLGLVWPSWRQVAIGLGAALVLVALGTGLDAGLSRLFEAFGWPRTDAKLFEQLLGGLITPVGALVIGVTAGLGEEVAVRGVLQPRVGLVLANLAFTAAHAFQYGYDALLSVFLVGLALGVLRAYTNTTTSAITHGTYNFILVLAAALGLAE